MKQRIVANLDAEIFSKGSSYAGVIENLSKEGLYVKIKHPKTSVNFSPLTPLEFTIELPTGETLTLNCEVKWLCYMDPDDTSNEAGAEVKDPPQEYIELTIK